MQSGGIVRHVPPSLIRTNCPWQGDDAADAAAAIPVMMTIMHRSVSLCAVYVITIAAAALLMRASTAEAFAAHPTASSLPSSLPLPLQLRFYNSFSRSKEPFQPQDPARVTLYSCGPTLYDHAHIGNLRAFITYDVVKRWLRFAGYSVEHVCNLTDVDDKIIRKAQAEKTNTKEIADRYAAAFFEDLALLNVQPATKYPRVTDHIADILRMIEALVKKGHAYERNGSVYFRTASFPGYGTFGALRYGSSRDAANSEDAAGAASEKEDPRDFALWKAAKEADGDCVWQSPYGKGRPGWHIECSAMCQALLGDTVDIHAGGADLQFPHHCNEMAQAEAATGKQFCKYWLHNGLVTAGDAQAKMSKSLGGFRTLRDVARTPLQARAFRHFVVSSHYRAPLHFNDECVAASANALAKVDRLIQTLHSVRDNNRNAGAAAAQGVRAACEHAVTQFVSSMADDMHTPTAVTVLHTLCNEMEKVAGTFDSADADAVLTAISEMDKVLGLFYEVPEIGPFRDIRKREHKNSFAAFDTLPERVRALIDERARAKQAGNFALADQLRQQLQEQGYQLIDSKSGTQVLRSVGEK